MGRAFSSFPETPYETPESIGQPIIKELEVLALLDQIRVLAKKDHQVEGFGGLEADLY